MKRIILTIAAVLVGAAVHAQETVTVPAGQILNTKASMPLGSEISTKGQNVKFVLNSDFDYNGHVIAPAGSSVTGTVIEVSKAKKGSQNGQLLVRFNMIVTSDGVQIPVAASVKTYDKSGVLSGGTRMDAGENKDIATQAGAGVLAGVMLSPLAGGGVGKGTMVATAVGSSQQAIKAAYEKGEEVLIPVNSAVELILTQAVTVAAQVPTQD